MLGHLLGEDETVREGMGEFLEQTWRMRPEVNAFISETFYEGRLEPAEICYGRSVAAGNGLRFVEVEHEGHRTSSPEEAAFVRDEIERLLGTPYVDEHGERVLGPTDIVVVAPYNAQVRCLRAAIPDQRDPDRHGGQVPGPGSPGRLLLDGELERRGRPARPGLPLLAQSPQRGDLESEVPGVPGREPAAAGRELSDGGADAARERAVPIRRGGDAISSAPVELCADVFRAALPDKDVRIERGRYGDRARVDVGEGNNVRYAYLAPSLDDRFELHLYPADTLEQAREFYAEPSRVQRLLALRSRGWRIDGNFHFGYAARGLAWTETSISVDAYVEYWVENISRLRSLDRSEWDRALGELIELGVMAVEDLPQFDHDFRETRRQSAYPRPGLRCVYAWPNHRLEHEGTPTAVAGRIAEVLVALGERQ